MLEVTLHEDADEELKTAASFYELRQAGLGEMFLRRISEGFELIRDQPLAGQILFGRFQRLLIRQFPYSLVYRVESDRVLVIAVAHWSRRPRYWEGR